MLQQLAYLSQSAGSRADYVQGGGGNTSVKLGNGLMAIKASGYRLRQVTETDGFAVVEVDTLKDVTVEQGYKELRPSVEVGFHALLRTFVLHTHPVYANLALCSEGGLEKLEDLMEDIPYITVPYVNPGADLCAAIKERLKPDTKVLFMQNHGLVVTADTAEECLALQDEINERVGRAYGVTRESFDAFSMEIGKTLYPDQQVYLNLTEIQREVMTAVMFIQFTLMNNALSARPMDSAAMGYIAGWEGEAYRKKVLT
ncbi:MAG: class II aldolase/adducin family protein [Oscillospiraceae bacterium]|nr:class II aldolase/adducin family protein [Oscillospiraceae bacterium]